MLCYLSGEVMNEMQKRRSSKPQPGCMGRMVKLFDMDDGTARNKLLMDKPRHNSYSPQSCPIDLVMPSGEGDPILSQFGKTSDRTSIKMHLDHELLKEVESKYTPPNLVARLMGLDTLPKRRTSTSSKREEGCGSTMMGLEEALPSWSHEPELLGKAVPCDDQLYTEEFISYAYHRQGLNEDEKDVTFVGQKCVEARNLVNNESLDSFEESEGLVEILDSKKDLFLEFLQQPNSLFAQHPHEMSALKPAKTADNNSFPGQKTEKWVTKPTQVSQADVWNRTHFRGFPVSSNWKADDDPQPTSIMVLKPGLEKASHIRQGYTSPSLSPRTPHGENCFMEGVYPDAQQSRDMAKEITNIIRENLGSLQMDDPFFSSVFSGGYNGDESSPNKSENEFAAGSHSETMSPASRFSWGYTNQFASCSSSVSHVPRARESSVCREAKKRLSRRWNAMGLNESSQQHRHTRSRSSSTLGEMLALSEIKKPIRSPVNNEEEPMGSCPLRDNETADYSPQILTRSKSAPLSADGNYEWVNDGMLHPEMAKSSNEKELLKDNSLKLLVSSPFFSKNQRPDKVNSNATFCKDGYSATLIRTQGLQIGDITEGTGSHEVGLSVTKPVITVKLMESQDQPSPISVLEPFFADDDSRSGDSAGILSTEHPVIEASVSKTNSPMLGKSPPIESVARTLCSCANTVSACPFNLSSVCSGPEEEQDWCILVQALVSRVGLSKDVSSDACVGWWHAPQTPLDPLLRDKYVNGTDHFMHEAEGRRWSNRKLVFDSVNQALKDIAQLELETIKIKDSARHPKNAMPILVDQVWATMSRWISDKARCVSNDTEDINCNLVVERVARREVAGKRWFDGYMEMNRVGNDIELKLVDELLEEAVLQLTARYGLRNSLCHVIVV